MSSSEDHSRRAFLQGRAAVRAATTQAQQLVDSAAQLLGAHRPATPVAQLELSRQAMACQFAVLFHAADAGLKEAVLAALDLVEALETQLTIYRPDSELLTINRLAADAPVEVEPALFKLLQLCQQLHRETNGALDITSGPLSRCWGFFQRSGRVPSESELATALAQVDARQVLLDPAEQTIRFARPGIEINCNAIGKGYALDRAAALLTGQTDYLWHAGGSSVLARGADRGSATGDWQVGLRDPLDPQRRLAQFTLRDRALATAGGATQFFEAEGQRYSHLLDPRTGRPAQGIYSATVLAPTAALADGLATAFFVMPTEQVEDYCQRHPQIGAVLVRPGESQLKLESFGLSAADWQQN